MARITRYSKDKFGESTVNAAFYILLVWLSVAGQYGQKGFGWYYLGVFVISSLYGVALYERNPKIYETRKSAVMFSMMIGVMISLFLSFVIFVLRNPDRFRQMLAG